MKLQLTELQEDITAVLNYCYDDELKDFNEWYNDTNIYWDEEQELDLAIKDNWDDCKNHIFVKIHRLEKLTRYGLNERIFGLNELTQSLTDKTVTDEKTISKLVTQVAEIDDNLSKALDIMTDEQVKEWLRVTSE
tara:strand:+ start:940 stop:1344 length:405 start_codon:yes stop_codon:yes gene_type:complete